VDSVCGKTRACHLLPSSPDFPPGGQPESTLVPSVPFNDFLFLYLFPPAVSAPPSILVPTSPCLRWATCFLVRPLCFYASSVLRLCRSHVEPGWRSSLTCSLLLRFRWMIRSFRFSCLHSAADSRGHSCFAIVFRVLTQLVWSPNPLVPDLFYSLLDVSRLTDH